MSASKSFFQIIIPFIGKKGLCDKGFRDIHAVRSTMTMDSLRLPRWDPVRHDTAPRDNFAITDYVKTVMGLKLVPKIDFTMEK